MKYIILHLSIAIFNLKKFYHLILEFASYKKVVQTRVDRQALITYINFQYKDCSVYQLIFFNLISLG